MDENAWLFAIGAFIAVVSYFSKNFILEPVLEFRKVKGKIQNKLKFYANKNHAEDESIRDEITKEYRQLSCDLEESYFAISFRRALSKVRFLPEIDKVGEAASNLIGLSNSVGTKDYEDISNYQKTIKRNLKIS